MLEIYFKTVRDIEFKPIQDFRPEAGSTPTKRPISPKMAEDTGLELTDIRDSLDRFELPRIERIGESILCFRPPPQRNRIRALYGHPHDHTHQIHL